MGKKQKKQQRREEEEIKKQPVQQASPMAGGKLILYQCLAIFAFAFVLYANTIPNSYAVDDTIVITKNTLTKQGFAGIHKIMTTDAFYGFFGEDYKFVAGGRYRPLSIVTFAIEYQFFGMNPHVSHFINILLYGLVCVLVFLVLLELFKSPKLAPYGLTLPFIAALIFTAHPIHTEVVANIKGRDEIMGMLGSILTLYLVLLYVRTKKPLHIILAAVSYIMALLSKENSITFLAVIPLTLYFFTKAKAKDYALVVTPVFVLAVIFVLMRKSFTDVSIMADTKEILNNPFVHATAGEKYATIAFTFGEYIRLLFFPITLTYDYYYNQVPIVDWDNPKVIISFLINLAIIAYAIRGIMKKDPVSYAILYYFITISIVSNILFTVGIAMNERFVFMSSFGVVILFAMLLLCVMNYIKAKKWTYKEILNPTVTWVVLGAILSAYTVRTVTRNTDWKNDFVLFKADAGHSPNSAKTANAYGGELVSAADTAATPERRLEYLKEADRQLTRALKIYPDYLNAWLLLGNARYKLNKNPDEAIELYTKTLKLKPGYFEGNFNLGTVLLEAGRAKQALPYLEGAIASKPDKVEPRYNLADAYTKAGYPDSAIMTYKDLALKQPGNALPIYKVGVTYGRVLNNLDSSIFYINKAINIGPKQELYYEDLGVAYGLKQDYANAIKAGEDGIKMNPKYAPFYFNIGITYRQLKDETKAKEYIKKANELDPKRYPLAAEPDKFAK